ncbi:putative adenylyltransferase/sulfurtransferase MoeZ [Aquicella siphonis]|uniref:Molybdopterin-synthase adenylyltransferase n=1 Tax=Aquicella siphonis TaxID=254247 RepID=A0A5E4PIX3_9COXI|nr:ThiF family adenylyltransferase [Aquicella siphonis]VVC77019.1 putative adenylyltransferase/sulfurtransferase MoeZ [Aquicella siphonis]
MTRHARLNPEEIIRYQQQIKLPGMGLTGQLKLKNAKVACIGAGGLGTPLLLYLASSGVGTLGIVDHDCVDRQNLHRQILYHERHFGKPKVECAREQLAEQYPDAKIRVHQVELTGLNARELISQYDVIADCSDNFATRFLLNDLCVLLDKPLVSASVSQFEGQCLTVAGQHGPCLRCLFPVVPERGTVQTCEQGGVLPVVPGILGMIQAGEVIKWILQEGVPLMGRLLHLDMLKMAFKEYHLPKNSDCEICGFSRGIKSEHPFHANKRSHINMNEYHISPLELRDLLSNKPDIQLLDVRTTEKHNAYHIGGQHIPLEELPGRLNELDPDKLIVTYCTSGGRSMRALEFLLSEGFNLVKSLDGGMTAWKEQCA